MRDATVSILMLVRALVIVALVIHFAAADNAPVPLTGPLPYGKPISELCCPQGSVPNCWCGPYNVAPRPPCDPGWFSGPIPGVNGDACYAVGTP